MSYNFRIRINRSSSASINTDLAEVSIPSPNVGISLFLRAASQGKSIKDAEQLVLAGEGFNSEAEALEAGMRFEEALMITLARIRLGADFGDRAPKSSFSDEGLKLFFHGGRKTLNNVHGLMVYPAVPKPLFGATGPLSVSQLIPVGSFEQAFSEAVGRNRRFTARDRLAFTLFNSSFFQPSADSRFLLLTMAVEALIEPVPKSPEARRYVDGFTKQIEESSLQQSEKDSLIGSLKWLRDESINKAGQRLAAERLGERVYEGKSAAAFFSTVYSTRSNLVHGKTPFPTFQRVNALAAPLEVFVSDLLTTDGLR